MVQHQSYTTGFNKVCQLTPINGISTPCLLHQKYTYKTKQTHNLFLSYLCLCFEKVIISIQVLLPTDVRRSLGIANVFLGVQTIQAVKYHIALQVCVTMHH